MYFGGQTRVIGNITSIPTTFIFTPRPSLEQKWVKNAYKLALGAKNRHLRL